MPVIDTERSVHWRGLGDTVGLAWLAEGTRGLPNPLTFHAKRGSMQHTILNLLRQPVSDGPGRSELFLVPDSYAKELADGGRKLRLEYLRNLLGFSTGFVRPKAQIAPDDLAWATDTARDLGEDLVLLFPQTDWLARQWPSSYWVDLAWQLHNRGVAVLTVLQHEDRQYANTPRSIWGHDLNKTAALMTVARLVVGNDSGPAHLAGTLGIKTFAICGPTKGHCVFGHIPEVVPLTTHEAPGCAGCHFQRPPYRAACDQGCQVLYALKLDVILSRVLSELNAPQPAVDSVRPTASSREPIHAVRS